MYLYHYYEQETGPFLNLSDLPINEAQKILSNIKQINETYIAQRSDVYMQRRIELETMARELFILKGGKPVRNVPHYMVIEECEWLQSWYRQGTFIKIPVSEFDTNTLSFSYGDMFPTFSLNVKDGKEYRKQIYTYNEIIKVIEKYGLPQTWNKDGKFGPERYIEVQVWSDEPISKYYSRK